MNALGGANPDSRPTDRGFRFQWTWRRQLVALFLFTVFVRFLFDYLIFPHVATQMGLLSDDGYDRIARNLADGFGYVVIAGGPPTMKRVPLYPLFLAGVFRFLGADLLVVQALQAIIDGVTAVLISVMARKLFHRRAALTAGLLFALYPLAIVYSSRFYTESLYTMLLCALVYVVLALMSDGGYGRAAVAGFLLGGLALTRSVTLVMPLFLFPAIIFNRAASIPLKMRWRAVGVMAVGMGLMLMPWVMRNYRLTGQVLLGGTTLGAPLYHGYYVSQHWHWGADPARLHRQAFNERRALIAKKIPRPESPRGEYEANRLVVAAVVQKMTHDPWGTGWRFLRNLVLVWFLTRHPPVMLLLAGIHFALLLLAGHTVWAIWRRGDERWALIFPLISIIVCFVTVHALIFPFARYLVPIMPLVIVLASESVARRLSWLGNGVPSATTR